MKPLHESTMCYSTINEPTCFIFTPVHFIVDIHGQLLKQMIRQLKTTLHNRRHLTCWTLNAQQDTIIPSVAITATNNARPVIFLNDLNVSSGTLNPLLSSTQQECQQLGIQYMDSNRRNM